MVQDLFEQGYSEGYRDAERAAVSFHARARGLTPEDSAIMARLAKRGHNDWRMAEDDIRDATIMRSMARLVRVGGAMWRRAFVSVSLADTARAQAAPELDFAGFEIEDSE